VSWSWIQSNFLLIKKIASDRRFPLLRNGFPQVPPFTNERGTAEYSYLQMILYWIMIVLFSFLLRYSLALNSDPLVFLSKIKLFVVALCALDHVNQLIFAIGLDQLGLIFLSLEGMMFAALKNTKPNWDPVILQNYLACTVAIFLYLNKLFSLVVSNFLVDVDVPVVVPPSLISIVSGGQ
jgi:hypothetical protein